MTRPPDTTEHGATSVRLLATHEIEAVRRLLAEGRDEEALRLHAELSGQGLEEAREAIESLKAGL